MSETARDLWRKAGGKQRTHSKRVDGGRILLLCRGLWVGSNQRVPDLESRCLRPSGGNARAAAVVVVEETTTVCRMSRIEGWVLRERKRRVGMCREEEVGWENGRGGFIKSAEGGGSAGRLTD